jgi:hypothetical protein
MKSSVEKSNPAFVKKPAAMQSIRMAIIIEPYLATVTKPL